MDKVSVIVPVYNVRNYLSECLDSLLRQTYFELELILIDDGSSDGSENICDDYQKRDSRIQVYHRLNSGPAATRNFGLTKASGKYVMFVDSDDWIDEKTVEICYNTCQRQKCDIVMFNLLKFNKQGMLEECQFLGQGNREFQGAEIKYLEEVLIIPEKKISVSNVSMVSSVCKFYQKNILTGCYFPEEINYGEDTCFLAQVLKKTKKVVYLEAVFYHYRMVNTSLVHRQNADFLDRKLKGVNWILDFYRQNRDDEFLNEFCFKNYSEAVCTVYEDVSISKKDKKRMLDAFLSGIQYKMHFDEIDYTCKNRNLQIIRYLVMHKHYTLLNALMRLVQLKNKRVNRNGD